LLQLLTFWLPGQSAIAHLRHVRRCRFLTGGLASKSEPRFRAKLKAVSSSPVDEALLPPDDEDAKELDMSCCPVEDEDVVDAKAMLDCEVMVEGVFSSKKPFGALCNT
jgi:hypothetical protein